MKQIECTKAEFKTLNAKIHQWCEDNIDGYNATKWSDEVIHPTNGKIAVKTKPYMLDALTTVEKKKVITQPSDWIKNAID